jgi:hypothetical protein
MLSVEDCHPYVVDHFFNELEEKLFYLYTLQNYEHRSKRFYVNFYTRSDKLDDIKNEYYRLKVGPKLISRISNRDLFENIKNLLTLGAKMILHKIYDVFF